MAVIHVPACCDADEEVDQLDPVADQHRHVAADRHPAVVEHPVPEPEGPVEELAAGAPAGQVVDGRGVGIGGDQVEEAHGSRSWQGSGAAAATP